MVLFFSFYLFHFEMTMASLQQGVKDSTLDIFGGKNW